MKRDAMKRAGLAFLREELGRGILLIAAAVAVVVAIQNSGVFPNVDALKAWVDAELAHRGALGLVFFVAVAAVLTGVGASRQLFAYVAGYAFGALYGGALTLLAEMIGVALGFALARWRMQGFVARRWARQIQAVDAFLESSPFQMTLVIRLLPISNNLIVNLGAGVSRIGVAPFMAGSLIGHMPQTFVFSLLGEGFAADGGGRQELLAVILFVLSMLIAWRLYRRRRRPGALTSCEKGARACEPR